MTNHDDTPLRPSGSEGQATGFTPPNPYEDEARERWGRTDAYKQSQQRVKKMTKEDWDRIGRENEEICMGLAAAAEAGNGPADPDVQALVQRHYDGLRTFYEPHIEMYRGLADMYAGDPRFAAHYDKYRPGLAAFLRDAMHAFCDARQ